ncbi:AMP-binding protein [Amycolatopsis sp. K13G38]|uniref:AMP-binding protein n=1 Tax=Amycolatopsis acididurans TaxID=2724524 RepID=A0ABX1J365_9PSEU|nr:AMP-binding protein [Amycolatopsis acididurans]NKQ54193.1 AMP-binding protein [Amycolatopsis acididurans]
MSQDIGERRAALLAAYPRWVPRTLGSWLDHCADRHGDRPFIIGLDDTLSYERTAEWSARLADGLVALGVSTGDRVGLLMANHLEFAPLKFAIARAGAVAVPFNYLYRKDELAYVLAQSGCRVLVTMTGHGELDYLSMLDEAAPGWQHGPTKELPELVHVVQLPTGGARRAGVPTVAELAELGARHTMPRDRPASEPGDVADILYTSGTTGSPKGVCVTHDAVLRTAFASALTRGFEDGRRIVFALPCYHMFGYVEGLLAAMVAGGAVIPQPRFDPVGYFTAIERYRATDVLCVPTMTVALLEHPRRAEFDLSSAFAMLSGAAPAPVWLWERVRDELGICEITTGYGMTECGGAMTLTLPEDSSARTAETVGKPKFAGPAGLPGSGDLVEYRTADPITGNLLPHGTEGELVSRGPTAMLGFWRKPDETAAAFHDGWLRSGDLGVVGEDGYLRLTGRSKELYKSGGELVMPKEIEELLSAYPGISQVYAVGVPDERWGEAGCVCVVRTPGSTVGQREILDLCAAKLARFKVPKRVLFLEPDELPTTPTGKVQKFRLAEIAARLLEKSEV